MRDPPRVIGLLPPDVVADLQRAAQVGSSGSFKRRVAIDAAYDRADQKYPHLFKLQRTSTS